MGRYGFDMGPSIFQSDIHFTPKLGRLTHLDMGPLETPGLPKQAQAPYHLAETDQTQGLCRQADPNR